MDHESGLSPQRTVLITGASTGIGRAAALALDTAGWRVFAGVRRQEDGEALRASGSPRLEPVLLDVTRPDSIANAATYVEQALGGAGLTGLVNNAGIVVAGPLEFIAPERLREQLEINVIGVHAVTNAFLPALRRDRAEASGEKSRGRIVTIGSISGRMAAPMLGAYAMSKFALEAWSDALRIELAPQHIRVALIEPGPIATPLWPKSMLFNRRLTDELSPTELERCQGLYGRLMDKVGQYILKAEASALPVEHVVRAIEHALNSARPRTRYPIGLQARLRIWAAALIPDRTKDALIRRFLGL